MALATPRAWGPTPGSPYGKYGAGPLSKRKPLKPGKPGKPGVTTPGAAPAAPPTSMDNAMGMFRSVLGQIRSLQAPVDTAAIAAPYTAAQAASGQISSGLADNMVKSGQQAQDQYNQGRNDAQQHAAAFGITSGAGANPMGLQDNGTTLLAQQTQAQAAAAHQAGAAWASLLEGTKAGAVSKAQADRSAQDYQVGATLASNIPTWAQNEDTLKFQEKTAANNYLLALGTANDKRSNELRDYILNTYKAKTDAGYKSGLLDLGNRNATNSEARTTAEIARDAARVTHWDTVEARLNKAAAGTLKLQGVPQILAKLKGPAGKSSKKVTGYTITRIATDPTIGQIPGTESTYFSTVQNPPQEPGYAQVGAGKPVETSSAAGASEFSWSRYKAAASLAKTLNPSLTPEQIRGILGPTPKTATKKKKQQK